MANIRKKKGHVCKIGSYMANPKIGAHYVLLTMEDINMAHILIEKHKEGHGRMYKICPDCGELINWGKIMKQYVEYVFENYTRRI